MKRSPVVLFAYARPDHLRRTLQALLAAEGARDTELWVFSDGPSNDGMLPKIAAVRALLADPDWQKGFAEVHIVESPSNKGLARSIIEGVTQVLEENDRAIVLEDDLIVAWDFLEFMNSALEKHARTGSVGSVTGYCPLADLPDGYGYGVYAVPRSCSHGWATWRDRWVSVDWTGSSASRLWREPELRRRFNSTGTDKLDRLRRQLEGKIDSWSIMFNLWHTLENRYALYPVRNLVTNIGFDGSGTHTHAPIRMHSAIVDSEEAMDVEMPPEDARVLQAFKRMYSGSWPGRIRRTIRNWKMPSAVRELSS